MKNQEILNQIIAYIGSNMEKRGLSPEKVSEMSQQGGSDTRVSKKTIYNMLSKPSGTTMSTLLKVCDTLGIDLQHIFHTIDISRTADDNGGNRLVYGIDHTAYRGYTGEFHVFFLTTKPADEILDEKMLVHGTLTFGDLFSAGECAASLVIDSGDTTPEGAPFTKRYEGTLVYSSNGQMFCKLVSNAFGDMWFLVFDHGNLNNKDLACVLGCAATASSGIHRHPAIHRFCLCNKQQYPEISEETKNYIRGILRVKNREIVISEEKVKDFMEQDDLDPKFRRNLQTAIDMPENKCYSFSGELLKPGVSPDVYAKTLAVLCDKAELPHVFHIRQDDDTQLRTILKTSKDGSEKKAQ